MIPKTIIAQQKLSLSVSINSKLKKMAKDGYYLSGFFSNQFKAKELNDILEDWENITDKSDFNAKLKQIVLQNIKIIEQRIKEALNNREHIITEVFKLFDLSFYSAMITLSLSQIDGIMKEITNGNNGFYNSNNENKKVNPNRLKYLDDDLYIRFFSESELLNVENRNDYELFKKDISDLSLLNRHSILHGESTEFGHENNAIKVILLLVFIADLYVSNNDELYNE